jgi:hypothetical protein
MNPVERAIAEIDQSVGNYGYSESYGMLPGQMAAKSAVNYSINPEIARATAGTSIVQVKISCVKNGTGSGNTENPVFLFGGDAFTNTSRGYNAVQVVGSTLTTALTVSNGKNVVTFRHGDGTNNATYTVTLGTAGDYPFMLNSRSRFESHGMQIDLSDSTNVSQLTTAIKTFFLDEFGKAETNDLTTPKDLYQQATNGLFVKAQFKISPREGLIVNVLEVNNFTVSYYLYLRKIG